MNNTEAPEQGIGIKKQGIFKSATFSFIARGFFYLFKRLISILITVFVGITLTVLIANHPLHFELSKWDRYIPDATREAIKPAMEAQYAQYGAMDEVDAVNIIVLVDEYINSQTYGYGEVDPAALEQYIDQLMRDSGLNLAPVPRQMMRISQAFYMGVNLVGDLHNTLLLIGTAYLLVFLIGLPLALRLSQSSGSKLDKFISALAPVSSIPSWVIGILLVMIFAVELRWLPATKMTDTLPPETVWQAILVTAKHMVLPVMAIFLSAVFQLIYTWKTYLTIYSNEDYVELGKAKGLSHRILGNKYILRPTLPYMITSFVLTLVGVWQSIIVLELYFDWPGIGNLFIQALPNWNGESMYGGNMVIVVGIVALFAYLLGAAIFTLDLLYVLVDPRLRLAGQSQTARMTLARAKGLVAARTRSRSWKQQQTSSPVAGKHTRPKFSFAAWTRDWSDWAESIRPAWVELKRSPSAILGVILVAILLVGSIVIMVALPYKEYGRNWYLEAMPEKITVPRLALPAWVNWFRKADYPSTILLDSQAGQALRTSQASSDGMTQLTTLTYSFDYSYNDFPQDILIYFQMPPLEQSAFAAFTWHTPDGREFSISNSAVEYDGFKYQVKDNLPLSHRMVLANEHWKRWFVTRGDYPTPSFYVLFADPESDTAWALDGTYTLTIDITTFEKLTAEQETNLNAEVVILGQVYGPAGTDSMRRNLVVPLLWGLPYALMIGLAGAIGTTLLSLVVAATAAWLGGGVDWLLQKLIEANIILPVLAIATLLLAFFHLDMWMVLFVIILLNTFGSPTKSFRAAFLQVKEAPYIEAAQAYGASSWRIISKYFIPRILPVVIPQIIILIPTFVFLEATLGIFGVTDPRYPTWGKVLYSALRYGATYGSRYWVLQPLALLLLTSLAFVLIGYTLNRILNPRLLEN